MVTIKSILDHLASDNSTNAKLGILEFHKENLTLKNVFRLAYHPRINFGIKAIPRYIFDEPISLDHALENLETVLNARELTGARAINYLSTLLGSLSQDDAEVVELIIKRDLNCGVSATSANKIWKNLIPKQPQMLASPQSEKALSHIKYPAIAQLKADGARCFAEIRGEAVDDVILLTRSGNEYQKLDQLKLELINATFEFRVLNGPCMVDGELVARVIEDDKQVSMLRSLSNGLANKSLKNTITEFEANSMAFEVWDLVPLDCIYDGKTSKKYASRFEDLSESLYGYETEGRLIIVESELVHNLEEAKEIYKKYRSQGLEGIILKNTDSIWENKRSKNQVKFKEEITVDLRIVDVTEHTKQSGKLGSISLASDDGLIKVNCGSGFSDTPNNPSELDRTLLWNSKDQLIGQIAEIKCNGWISAAKRTDSVSLFLPVILKLRDDKTETDSLEIIFPDAKSVLI